MWFVYVRAKETQMGEEKIEGCVRTIKQFRLVDILFCKEVKHCGFTVG